MNPFNSSSSSFAQDLLDALIEFRQLVEKRGLGISGVYRDSGNFRALMRDLHPDMKKETLIVSALIDEGFLMRLHTVNANERARVSGQIKVWLDDFGLKTEDAQTYSNVLLAFCSGETLNVAAQGSADAQFELGNMFRDGQGVAQDLDQALGCYIRAAAQGHTEAKQALLQVAVAVASPNPAAPQPGALPKPAAPQPGAAPKPASPQPGASSLRNIYANKRVGECFKFGCYPQGDNGEIEPITWRVLEREADHLLVIAAHGLECKRYHEQGGMVTWADCSMRRWLNSPFMSKAFNDEERKCIMKTSIVNNAGPKTDDYVFLLSVDEASYLFENNALRRAKPTKYAVKNGVYKDHGCCWWWLRSHGGNDCYASCVLADGSVDVNGSRVDIGNRAVRPAFKIAL